MCLKDRFQDHPEAFGAVLTVLPLPPYPPVAQSVWGDVKREAFSGA